MALSNWDTLAVDENGESTSGVFTSRLGVVIEFYKNWLYVRDDKAWQDGGRFVSPVVMQVEEGNLSYKDVSIVARRGPQNGIYAVIQTTIYPESLAADCTKCKAKEKATWHDRGCPDFVDTKHIVMVGCGVYGYSGDEWVGVTNDSKKFLVDWTQGSEKIEVPLPRLLFNKLFSDDQIRAALALKGQVVSRFTDENVFVESDSHHFEDHIRKLDLSKALRFNQGDAFFASKVGTDIPATTPGTAEEPWLTQALKKDA